MLSFQDYFKEAIAREASDLHLVVGNKPALRVDGELIFVGDEVVDEKFMEASLLSILDANRTKLFHDNRELDFSLEFFDNRFRINLHFQSGRVGLAARRIKAEIPRPEEIGFSEAILKMANLKDGLILVTGPSGSGKSTTLAAIINIINETRNSHIITIEDPIEYIFIDKRSVVEQREVGYDTLSFANALKYVLRQDPNVIMIGEMRDSETMEAALTAAETGHLVLSTLHTSSAPETVARIVDSFPAYHKQQILVQLSLTLRGVISQQLIPKIGGGRVSAREVMINNPAVSNLILEDKVNQLATVIKTNYKLGMIDLDKSVEYLVAQGVIDASMAAHYQRNTETKGIYYN
jgi:twitching motility protein PilT